MDGTTVAMGLEDADFNLKVTHTYLLGYFFSWMYYLYFVICAFQATFTFFPFSDRFNSNIFHFTFITQILHANSSTFNESNFEMDSKTKDQNSLTA